MKRKPKHTPLPWNTSREDMQSYTVNHDDNTGEAEHVVYIYRNEQPRIAVFAGKLNNARDDARLIVNAVNAHADLLAACEAVLRFADDPNYTQATTLRQQVEAAIAKATGKVGGA